MILQYGDKRRNKFLKDGDVLKRMRNTGGGGKGLMAGGIVLFVFGFLLAAPCLLIGVRAALSVGGFFLIPGFLLIVAGKVMQNRKVRNYLEYYKKETGFDDEELTQVERELMEPDMVMFGNVPYNNPQGASKKNPQIPCMITRNYFVAPFVMGNSYIRRISDMILAAYSQNIPGINGYRQGLVFLSKRDEDTYNNGTLTRDVCMEIIGVLKERQPSLITGQMFVYNDKEYSVLTDGREIAEMFRNQDK